MILSGTEIQMKGHENMITDAVMCVVGMVSCAMVSMAAVGSLVDSMVHKGIIRRR